MNSRHRPVPDMRRPPAGRVLASAILGLALLAAEPATAEKKVKPDPEKIVRNSLDAMVFRSKGAEMTITMLLKNDRGDTRKRTMFARTVREDGLTRSLVRFLAPADVAGTAFLFIEKKNAADDQHMFLPALKVVRRIAGRQKNTRFMGSDFTFADLEWRDLDEATFTLAEAEKLGGDPCHVVDAGPKGDSQYARIRATVRQKDGALLRVRFFDSAGKEVKTLYVKALERVGGTLMATRIKMVDHKRSHSTFIAMSGIKLRDDLKAEAFSVRALKP